MDVVMHSVYFLDGAGKLIGTPVRVAHGQQAQPPAWEPQDGLEFLGWSRNLAEVQEDLYCVAVTRPKPLPQTFVTTFYSTEGIVLHEAIVEEGETVELPLCEAPAGQRFLGWECIGFGFEDRPRELIPADAGHTWKIQRDCEFSARCEPEICRVFVIDIRTLKPSPVIPLCGVESGAMLTQEDLGCLHLRRSEKLRPFRLQVLCDVVLTVTPNGVRAFDHNMRPLEMLELAPPAEQEESVQAAPAFNALERREA